MQNYRKILLGVLVFILIGAGVYGLYFYRTKAFDTCSSKLENLGPDHMCIATNRGVMVFELYSDSAPTAVSKIKGYSNNDKFYDGLEFYRVVKGFVAQAGFQDLNSRTNEFSNVDKFVEDRRKISEDKYSVEVNQDKLSLNAEEKAALVDAGFVSNPALNTRFFEYGSLGVANTGAPDSNSTEFFVVTDNDNKSENMQFLNGGKYTNFGKLIEGESVLKEINDSKIDPNYAYYTSQEKSKPIEVIKIFEIRVK